MATSVPSTQVLQQACTLALATSVASTEALQQACTQALATSVASPQVAYSNVSGMHTGTSAGMHTGTGTFSAVAHRNVAGMQIGSPQASAFIQQLLASLEAWRPEPGPPAGALPPPTTCTEGI